MAHQVHQPSAFPVMSRRLVSTCLGVAATLTSLFITVLAGEERGVTWTEKAVWIATGAVILLAAHLLPALTKGARGTAKVLVLPIWIGAILATAYTHATFFLNAQGRVGEQRALAVAAVPTAPVFTAAPTARSRTQIATDVAMTVRSMALLDARRCDADCASVAARRKALSARLDALKVEDAEAVRNEKASDAHAAAIDRRQKAQDDARVDPFMAGVASFVRLGPDQVSLLMAIVLGMLVDAVAVVSWASITQPPSKPRPGSEVENPPEEAIVAMPLSRTAGVFATAAVAGRVAANEPVLDEEHAAPVAPKAELAVESLAEAATPAEDGEAVVNLADLAAAIRAGRAKTTLTSIRAYLGCADSAAMALRRRLAEEHPDLFRPQPALTDLCAS
ncbi:hypothetical protein AWV80_10600 [Cupriavidus sp. UYMU48A]|nr:hypothetical protein AWV80_10600 [Cupriavidus sp. UYMU48A]